MFIRSILLLALTALAIQAADPTIASLRVTELMYHSANPTAAEIAAGGDSASDDSYDYIEFQNIGTQPLQLAGVNFTSGITYTFPSYTLAPGAYVVVCRSTASFIARYGNAVPLLGPYSGNFSNSGESVKVVTATGTTIQNFTYADSWYPITDGGGQSLVILDPTAAVATWSTAPAWAASSEPLGSPGALDGAAPTAQPVTFSSPHGLYSASFPLTLATTTTGAEIRYTLTGDTPTATTGLAYSGPLTVASTQTIRAVAFKTGYTPSSPTTSSFIFPADVVHQSPNGESPDPANPKWPLGQVNGQRIDYGMDPNVVSDPRWSTETALRALPSYSLVLDLNGLFDPAQGIYVNPDNDGDDWERPTSVELIQPDGTAGFQIDCGVRIRGGASRTGGDPKHGFRLYFRNKYGGGTLHFPLFGSDGTTSFEKLDLRCEQNYSWNLEGNPNNAMIREVFARDSQRALGRNSTRSHYCHLYINGQYWGIYMTEERADSNWAESYLGGSSDDYDMIKVEAGPYEVEASDGTIDAWNRLHDAAVHGFNADSDYFQVQGMNTDGSRNVAFERLVDVDNLIDYMLTIYYTADRDAPISDFLGNQRPNNFLAIYNRVHPDGFTFVRHDAEHTLDVGGGDRTGPYPGGSLPQYFNPQWLHQQLVANANYRARFGARARTVLAPGGALWDDVVTARLQARIAEVDGGVVAESARWGDAQRQPALNRDDWLGAIARVLAWVPNRATVVLAQLQAKGWLDRNRAPVAYADSYALASGGLTVPASAGVLINDADPDGDALTAVLVSGPSSGTVTLQSDGGFAFTPSPGFIGTSTFAYAASDGQLTSAPVTVSITVGPHPQLGGLVGEYFIGTAFNQSVLKRNDATIDFDWGNGAPDPLLPSDGFSVRWTGQVVQTVSDTYTFITTSDDGVRLWIDGQLVIDNWSDHGSTENSATLALLAGQAHDLVMEYYENGGGAVARLEWMGSTVQRAVVPADQLRTPLLIDHGLTAQFFTGTDLTNQVLSRIDATVDFDWGTGSPDPAVPADGFSARWSGQVVPTTTGTYDFYTTTDEGVKLTVNGVDIISDWTAHTRTEDHGSIVLQAGEAYNLTMEFFEIDGPASARLEWAGPGVPRQVIPSSQLLPLPSDIPPNAPPVVVQPAAADPNPVTGATATLSALGDDDNTEAGLIYTWSALSGPGQVAFSANGTNAAKTVTASFTYTGLIGIRCTITDGGGLSVTTDVQVQVASHAGHLTREVWTGIAGTTLDAIPLSSPPNLIDEPTAFEAPTDWSDNYGTRMSGWLIPAVSGAYTFWIASDDNGSLALSTTDAPALKQVIASVPAWTPARQWDIFASQRSAPVQLVAGQRYYIEALQKEGGGGDNLSVAWQGPGIERQVIPGDVLATYDGIFVHAPAVVAQPLDQTASPGQTATFTVVVSGVPTPTLQWQSSADGVLWSEVVAGSGATTASYTTAALTGADNGTLFRCVATNSQGSATSTAARLRIDTPPVVVHPAAVAADPLNAPTTTVSALGDDDGGEAALSYAWSTVSGPAAVAFDINGTNAAKQATATFAHTGQYVLRCTITDGDGQSVTSDVAVRVGSLPGHISRDVWTGIGGTTLDAIPLTSPPALSDELASFEAPTDWNDNYGTRARGWLIPAISGTYTFWIASDDNGALWLSSGEAPALKQEIASVPGWTGSQQWDTYASQRSATVELVAGQRYYIEAQQKEGGGGDNLAVAWQGPGIARQVIPGAVLATFDDAFVETPVIVTQPADRSAAPGLTATFSIVVEGNPAPTYQWQASADGVAWNDASGATAASFTTAAVTLADDGTRFRCVVTNSAGTATSHAAVLHVDANGDLIAHWPFDEGAGTVVHDVVGTSQGTASGATWQPGRDGTGLYFNGLNAAVNVPAPALALDTQVSVAFWAFGGTSLPVNHSVIYATNAGGSRELNIHLPWGDGNVYWDAGIDGSSGYDRIAKAANPAEYKGQWNHWVFTKNATTGTMAIYLNGVLWHSGSGLTRTFPASIPITALTIGSGSGGGYSYEGRLDDVRIYRTELDAGAVQALYGSYAPISVTQAPFITTQPADRSAAPGQTASFAVVASGAPTPTYQWQTSADGVLWNDLGGATSASVTTAALTLADDGTRFRCVASNSVGSATSVAAILRVSANGGLVARWPLDEGVGTIIDDVVGSNQGTASGASWQPGRDGSSLYFDGFSAAVTVPAPSLSLDSQVSVAFWAFGGASLPRNHSVFYAISASGARVMNIHLPWSDGNVYWDAGTDGSAYDRITKAANPAEYQGQWNHWVFTKDATAGTMAIYLNGALWHSGSGLTRVFPAAVPISSLTIGAFPGGGGSYEGQLDDVRVYNTALDAGAVQTLYGSYGPPPPAVVQTDPRDPPGSGTGLQAAYWTNANLTGTPAVSRVDAVVDFDWGVGSPDVNIPVDNFSARWTGRILARLSEDYTFSIISDDGVRLWVDGELLIDQWNDHAPAEQHGTITLQAGQQYDIVLEYYEHGGGAVARLRWQSLHQPLETIPATQLFPVPLVDGLPGAPGNALGRLERIRPRGSGFQLALCFGLARHPAAPADVP